MIVYCGDGVPRFALQASDLQCSFFVARESKRLQASGFAAGDCRQMHDCLVYGCFERARSG